MATFKGFVQTIQVRDDGWVEFVILAPHAGNTERTFFIRDLDGNIEHAHRRLAQLSLLRDALSRVLPVEVEYRSDEALGNVAVDLSIHPRPSIEGLIAARRVEGTVIGVAIAHLGPTSGVSPYRDRPDLAAITLLTNSGSIEQALLDLQRPDPLTAHAMLGLLQQAHRTRRPVAIMVSSGFVGRDNVDDTSIANIRGTEYRAQATYIYIQACEWLVVPKSDLNEVYAFIERLGQRYESYGAEEALALSMVNVTYTTAPGQTPEGDVSDNSTFQPQTMKAWVHGDSPLLARLEAALRDRLQVRLGLVKDIVHEVVLIGHLGSAARPIWIEIDRKLLPADGEVMCDNEPTIRTPTTTDLDQVPVSVSWNGLGYFNEGVWRFTIHSQTNLRFFIDGRTPCQTKSADNDPDFLATTMLSSPKDRLVAKYHAYLNGLHQIQLILSGRTCRQPFQLLAYRIR